MESQLTTAEINEYLHQYVIPNFELNQKQNIISSLYDNNGRILRITDKCAQVTGYQAASDAIGHSYADADAELARHIIGPDAEPIMDQLLAACRRIYKLQMLAIQQARVISFIDCIPYNLQYKSYLENCVPIFHPNGQVVAMQSVTVEFQLFKFTDLLAETTAQPNFMPMQIPNQEPPLTLPPRQHEILYLILQGVPQEYAAQILNIKRGTLARIISEQICPKFNIHGSNSKLLIAKAKQMGFHNFMPKSLWRPWVIILDDNVARLADAS